ncbi:hypothetical protein ZWY2020_056337 [Hordeum vulgare]|nr:hypothetical protein ZWY2020_056337 [Hordeum vulgare]
MDRRSVHSRDTAFTPPGTSPPIAALLSSPVPCCSSRPGPLAPAMAYSTDGSSFGIGGAPESNWPLSLDSPATEEPHRYELLVLPGRSRGR